MRYEQTHTHSSRNHRTEAGTLACKDKRAADRIKAVYSLSMGFSVEDVVSILMLDEETLRNYVKRYPAGGINALITDHYQGSFQNVQLSNYRN